MRSMLVAATVALFLMSGPAQEPRIAEQARRLHHEAFVFDGHVHMINRQLHLGGDIGDRLDDGQVDRPREGRGLCADGAALELPEQRRQRGAPRVPAGRR